MFLRCQSDACCASPTELDLNQISRILDAIRRRFRRTYAYFDPKLAYVCSHSAFLSSLYYFCWNNKFRREQQAVLIGRVLFEKEQREPSGSSAILRRNIHRIEKGLIMRPRRDTFALDYIAETVDCYMKAVESHDGCSLSDQEHLWATDVLAEYFKITASNTVIDEQRTLFQSLPKNRSTLHIPDRSDQCKPYVRDAEFDAVTYDDFLKLAKRRRSVRWFDGKPVPQELIEKAVIAAAQSPSACNRQPFEFRVFDSPDLVRRIAPLPAGTLGFDHNFPTVIVVIGKMSNYYDERDRHLIYIDGGLASMGLVYALETLGLSSCCINWPDIEEREQAAAEVLGLDSDERPIMFLAVGFPDQTAMVPYSEKKPVDQLCRFNFLGNQS